MCWAILPATVRDPSPVNQQAWTSNIFHPLCPPCCSGVHPPVRSPLRGTWCPDRRLCSPPSPPHARNLCVQSSAFLFYFFATRPHCDFDGDLNVDGRTLPKKTRRQRIPGADELLSCALIRQRKSESGKLCRRRGNQRSSRKAFCEPPPGASTQHHQSSSPVSNRRLFLIIAFIALSCSVRQRCRPRLIRDEGQGKSFGNSICYTDSESSELDAGRHCVGVT